MISNIPATTNVPYCPVCQCPVKSYPHGQNASTAFRLNFFLMQKFYDSPAKPLSPPRIIPTETKPYLELSSSQSQSDPSWSPEACNFFAHIDELVNPPRFGVAVAPADLACVWLPLTQHKYYWVFGLHPEKCKPPFPELCATLAIFYGTTEGNIAVQYSQETQEIGCWVSFTCIYL